MSSKLVLVVIFLASLLTLSACSSDSEDSKPQFDDAALAAVAREAVEQAGVVAYDFSTRRPVVDRSASNVNRVVFIMNATNVRGGDPVVYLSKPDASVSKIEYTR